MRYLASFDLDFDVPLGCYFMSYFGGDMLVTAMKGRIPRFIANISDAIGAPLVGDLLLLMFLLIFLVDALILDIFDTNSTCFGFYIVLSGLASTSPPI